MANVEFFLVIIIKNFELVTKMLTGCLRTTKVAIYGNMFKEGTPIKRPVLAPQLSTPQEPSIHFMKHLGYNLLTTQQKTSCIKFVPIFVKKKISPTKYSFGGLRQGGGNQPFVDMCLGKNRDEAEQTLVVICTGLCDET